MPAHALQRTPWPTGEASAARFAHTAGAAAIKPAAPGAARRRQELPWYGVALGGTLLLCLGAWLRRRHARRGAPRPAGGNPR
jgi:hypothetical protein